HEAFFCTDLTVDAAFILEGYARRWTIEVAFHEQKEFLSRAAPADWLSPFTGMPSSRYTTSANKSSVAGVQSVMRRLKARSGIAQLHWHRFRHGIAQTALRKAADIGTV